MTYNTQAVIIKYQKYKEYDRIYTVYTKDFGKLALIARGSNKIKSKLAGHLEPCVLSNLMFAEAGRLDILAQAQTVESFVSIRQNPQKFAIAAVLLESLDKLTQTHQQEEAVFRLLVCGLRWIEAQSKTGRQFRVVDFIYHYLLHLLIYLGHAPDLRHHKILKDLLVADICQDGIMVSKQSRVLILEYLYKALDEKRLYSFEVFNSQ